MQAHAWCSQPGGKIGKSLLAVVVVVVLAERERERERRAVGFYLRDPATMQSTVG
jgi:hypothetical protein